MKSERNSRNTMRKSMYKSFEVAKKKDLGIKTFFECFDKASFGAPREVSNKVVSCTNFNY